jgi:hypothetical protein
MVLWLQVARLRAPAPASGRRTLTDGSACCSARRQCGWCTARTCHRHAPLLLVLRAAMGGAVACGADLRCTYVTALQHGTLQTPLPLCSLGACAKSTLLFFVLFFWRHATCEHHPVSQVRLWRAGSLLLFSDGSLTPKLASAARLAWREMGDSVTTAKRALQVCTVWSFSACKLAPPCERTLSDWGARRYRRPHSAGMNCLKFLRVFLW